MLRNYLILIYLAAVWGGAFTLMKFGLRTTGPITEMAARGLIAFAALLAICLALKKDIRGHARHWPGYLVFAVLGVVQLWLADAYSLEFISAGLTSVMVSVAPLTTFIITAILLREDRVTKSNVSGLVLGVAGLVLVIGPGNIMTGGTVLLGVLLVTGGFILFAVNGVIAPRLVKEADPIVSAAYFMGIGTLILTALAFIFGDPFQTEIDTASVLVEVALGIFPTASGYVAFYYLIKKAGPFFTSTTFYILPVFGMLSGVIFLKDKLDATQVVGIVVVLFGIYLINREKLKAEG